MKHLRKSILTLLALTLFGGAGAWAQGPTQVTQITTDLIADWQGVNEAVTLADLQALGFVAVDENTARAWTGAPQGDYAMLMYGFNEGNGSLNYMLFDHGNAGEPGQGGISKGGFYDMIANGVKWFYTGSPAIELTKAGANQWTLGQTPDYDLELQVEYYEAHALKNIPAGWQVMVNGVDKTAAIDGDSLMIVETDSVTLVPPADLKPNVKSVTLADDVQTITIGGVQFIGQDGDSWATIAANNQDKIELVSGYILYQETDYSTKVLSLNDCDVSNFVSSENSNYQASNTYQWCNW